MSFSIVCANELRFFGTMRLFFKKTFIWLKGNPQKWFGTDKNNWRAQSSIFGTDFFPTFEKKSIFNHSVFNWAKGGFRVLYVLRGVYLGTIRLMKFK